MRPNGFVLYDGPSRFDYKPIVAISTGFHDISVNPKTGPMIQLWIIRSDIPPVIAAITGDDASICGNCPLRTAINDQGKQQRLCYVQPFQAPRAVYDAYHRRRYPYLESLRAITVAHSGQVVRLGAYGDPAALPVEIIASTVAEARRWTGYTHQWRAADARLKAYLMASVDTLAEFEEARSLGWRTFRVRHGPGDTLQPGEITCPASPEAHHRTTCANCTLCNGVHPHRNNVDLRKNIAILAHGKGSALFGRRLLPVIDSSALDIHRNPVE